MEKTVDAEQFKKDVAKIIYNKQKEFAEKLGAATVPSWQSHTGKEWFYDMADQILAHPFLAPYLKLLEMTRDTCPECKGVTAAFQELIDYAKEEKWDCLTI